MKNNRASDALDNQDRLAMKEFVGGDRFATQENKEEDPFGDDDEQDDDDDKIVPLEEVNVERFIGIHPNHLRQVQRMVGNISYTETHSIKGRFGGDEG